VDEPEFDVFRVLEKLADPKFKIPFDENATFTCDPEALREFNERVWCSCRTGVSPASPTSACRTARPERCRGGDREWIHIPAANRER
jgi:hypothetical protein